MTRESQAQSISLIAHSMGNRALTAALKELQLELRDQSRLFNQVILAAPDIDADEFRESIVPGMMQTANRFTLYASARDEALAASQLVHRGPRAGDAGRGLVVVPGIDTIDVTQIDTERLRPCLLRQQRPGPPRSGPRAHKGHPARAACLADRRRPERPAVLGLPAGDSNDGPVFQRDRLGTCQSVGPKNGHPVCYRDWANCRMRMSPPGRWAISSSSPPKA